MKKLISNAQISTSVVAEDTDFYSRDKCCSSLYDGVFTSLSGFESVVDANIGFCEHTGKIATEYNGINSYIDVIRPTQYVQTSGIGYAKHWVLTCSSTDVDTNGTGAKRTEFRLPFDLECFNHDKLFTYGFLSKIDENISFTTDEQIITQIHAAPQTGSPIFSLIVKGSSVIVQVRTGASTNTIPNNLATLPFNTQTDKWVVAGKSSLVDGFLKIWRNGALVVDWVGSFGYTDSSGKNYLKSGYYHWTEGNTWQPPLTRTLRIQGPWVVAGYRPEEMLVFVNRHSI